MLIALRAGPARSIIGAAMARRREPPRSAIPAGSAPGRRLRELHARSPGEFTAARDALAKELAAEGHPDAPRVKRLRRPTAALWIVNALARNEPDAVAALLEAGDRLRKAQVKALRGDATELREATAALHQQLRALTAAAPRLAAAGLGREPGAAVLGEVEGGLRAAAIADAEVRAALRDAVLERVPSPGGVELLAGLSAVPDAPAPASRKAAREKSHGASREKSHGTSREKTQGAAREEEEDAGAARAEAERRERERRAEDAAMEADRLARAQEGVEARLRDAERLLEDAQRRVAALRSEAESARRLADSARERAERAARESKR